MNNVSGSMRDTLRGVALVGLGLLAASETARGHVFEAVSYTHLTLPTNREV